MQFVERPDHAPPIAIRRTRLTARSPKSRQAPRLLEIQASPVEQLLGALAALAVERSVAVPERHPAHDEPP